MLTDFQNSFSGRLSGIFATNSYLNIPPHLQCVATLPCEVSVFQKWPCSRRNFFDSRCSITVIWRPLWLHLQGLKWRRATVACRFGERQNVPRPRLVTETARGVAVLNSCMRMLIGVIFSATGQLTPGTSASPKHIPSENNNLSPCLGLRFWVIGLVYIGLHGYSYGY